MVRDGNIKPPVPWPPRSSEPAKKSIALNVIEVGRPGASSQETSRGATQSASEDSRAQAVKAYTESGYFTSVVTAGEPADLQADITVLGKGGDILVWNHIRPHLYHDSRLCISRPDREDQLQRSSAESPRSH